MRRRWLGPGLVIGAAAVGAAVAVPVVNATSNENIATVPVTIKGVSPGLTFSNNIDNISNLVTHCTASATKLTSSSVLQTGVPVTFGGASFGGCTSHLDLSPSGGSSDVPLGGTTAIKAHGVWTATYVDAADSGEAPGPGDSLSIQPPKGGLTASTVGAAVPGAVAEQPIAALGNITLDQIAGLPNGTAVPIDGCLETVSPAAAPSPITGSYNDATGALSLSGAELPYAVTQIMRKPKCVFTTSGATQTTDITGTYQLTPRMIDLG